MKADVAASYRYCEQAARRAASNFYYAFWLLPRAKRQAMCALYAFLRQVDDVGDAEGADEARRRELADLRKSLERALEGRCQPPLMPALMDTVRRHEIPRECLFAVLDGVAMDLDGRRYETFDDLQDYCHHVASVVGVACIHVWGFRSERALRPARACGIAFQLTNILRDLKEDARRGRVYLPIQDLRRFHYTEEELKAGVRDDRFRALMRFEIDRAERFYHEAAELNDWLAPDGQPVFQAMSAIYGGLLEEIKRRDGDVFTHRVSLSRWRKLHIAARSLWGQRPLARTTAFGGAAPR